MDKETCEGCNRTAEDLDCAYLCRDCQDKAASYDIESLERRQLARAIQNVLPKLATGSPTVYETGEIYGRLRAVLERCRFKVEEPVEA
jgi:hypothetical protein